MQISSKSCIFAVFFGAKSSKNVLLLLAKSLCFMLKRKIISELESWLKDSKKKALLLKGARQVGKTTIVREFAKNYYAHFVEINFERLPLVKQAFDGNLDADSIISKLSLMGFGPFVEHETLVFFDEIQTCPNARTAIKFLIEDARFDYIESGSLLGLNYADVGSYPVGFEQGVNMYPLDFEEFLWAKGVPENVVDTLKSTLHYRKPIDNFMHEQLSKYYREYLIVGGMPEVVNTYLHNVDFSKTLQVQRSIVDSYRDDIAKYAGNEKNRAKLFFDAIPSELSKEKKRFIIADIEQKAAAQK
ncbi:MAG: AAA family ATPase, partial [Paludibacteraceae bacterium]|nr:AAA family ATPase [Paludibacteraceae bacterium]